MALSRVPRIAALLLAGCVRGSFSLSNTTANSAAAKEDTAAAHELTVDGMGLPVDGVVSEALKDLGADKVIEPVKAKTVPDAVAKQMQDLNAAEAATTAVDAWLNDNGAEGMCQGNQRPCKQVCQNAETKYHKKDMFDNEFTIIEFPSKLDGHRIAAKQHCAWKFDIPEGYEGGKVFGNLTIHRGRNTKNISLWYGGKEHVINLGNLSVNTFNLVANLPVSITLNSDEASDTPDLGYFTFRSKVHTWKPLTTWQKIYINTIMFIRHWTIVLIGACLALLFVALRKDLLQPSSPNFFLTRLTARKALNQEELNLLCPVSTWSPEHGEQNTECSVCLLDFESGDQIRCMKCPAKHAIHAECAEEWLSRKGTCPVCRFDMIGLLPERKPDEHIISVNDFYQSYLDGEAGDIAEYSVLPSEDNTVPDHPLARALSRERASRR